MGNLTPGAIDAMYASLRRSGGMRGQPLSAGTLARVHVVLRAASGPGAALGLDLGQPGGACASHRQRRPGTLSADA